MTNPVPYFKGQRDYYSRKDLRYSNHIAEIDTHERIDARINASSGDHSYSVMVTRKDIKS